ncbi:MAG: preprotein translocase subunit SecG [Geminicoccaceae bacterium]|nr:preprotein translocase subunit SecG [Geminicoccaceae bacterium]
MTLVVLVVHLMIALALVGVILIQRSEGGALSGLGGGTFGGMMTGCGAGNLLTRATAVLAAGFMATSILLAILAGHGRGPAIDLNAPLPAPVETAPAPAPAKPTGPQAPVAQ